jgi:hypothetical protein
MEKVLWKFYSKEGNVISTFPSDGFEVQAIGDAMFLLAMQGSMDLSKVDITYTNSKKQQFVLSGLQGGYFWNQCEVDNPSKLVPSEADQLIDLIKQVEESA